MSSTLTRETSPAVDSQQRARFGETSRDFGLALYEQVANEADGNLFLSPYSVRVALGMLFAGAEGETETEMREALRFSLPEPTLHAAFNATAMALEGRSDELYGEHLADEPDYTPSEGDLLLRTVNGTFVQQGMTLHEPYLDTLALHYGSGLFAADFAGHPERERLAINAWVEELTETRIPELLPENSIKRDVAMVLVNSIYFKGAWLDEFNPEQTADEVFDAPDGDVTVPMMNGGGERYASGDGYQALELPYIAPAVRMLIILPDEGRFDEIEAALDRQLLDRIRGELSVRGVSVKLPKFEFQSDFSLPPAMQALGMRRAFTPGQADLSGITGAPNGLVVSDILHSTFVSVDEQGTEAAAATAVILRGIGAPSPAEFHATRPFLFVIHDEPTGQLLFIGRVVDPS